MYKGVVGLEYVDVATTSDFGTLVPTVVGAEALGLSMEWLPRDGTLGLRLGDDAPLRSELDVVFKLDIFSLASLSSNTHKISLMFFLIFSSLVEEETEFK